MNSFGNQMHVLNNHGSFKLQSCLSRHDHILFSYIDMSCNVGSKKRSTIFSLLIHPREAV